MKRLFQLITIFIITSCNEITQTVEETQIYQRVIITDLDTILPNNNEYCLKLNNMLAIRKFELKNDMVHYYYLHQEDMLFNGYKITTEYKDFKQEYSTIDSTKIRDVAINQFFTALNYKHRKK